MFSSGKMLDLNPIRARIEAAREIAASIPQLTLPGQLFSMERIIALLSEDVRHRLGERLGRRHGHLVAYLDRLAEEAARPVPNVAAFHEGIGVLLDALTRALADDDRPLTPRSSSPRPTEA
jgi:hypothetical protein